jgi:hypothetical protein
MQRRSFLRNFSLATIVLGAPVISNAAAGNTKQRTVSGKVHSNGKGIANVSVTDGYSVVSTDTQGNYSFDVHSNAAFVYISTPAGYAFNQQNHIAWFYQSLSADQLNAKADFSLEKLTVDDNKHQFVVWADTQMISQADCDQLKATAVPDLKALVASYPKDSLFHGIGCGDLVWDKFQFFKDYKEAIAATGVTFFNVIGNHDMDLDARTDDYSAKTFKQQFGPTYYSYNRGQVHYVVLDDVFFVGTAKKYIGYITESQLQWLENDLKLVKPGTTVVLSVHIPTNTGAARRAKKEEEMGGVVTNRKQLYKILAPYKVHIMSGHTHFNEAWEEDNIMEHNHGTVCGAWWTGPVCGDGTPMGYGVYEVNGSEVQWYYKSTGKDKDHQLRIYEKGRLKEAPAEIVANVWNWDSKWKVEWWEDGVAKGAMEQRIARDPWAIELYAGPELPAKHKFVEPTLADHLFFAKPSAGAKQVTVKATDRFGKSYSETINLV